MLPEVQYIIFVNEAFVLKGRLDVQLAVFNKDILIGDRRLLKLTITRGILANRLLDQITYDIPKPADFRFFRPDVRI